MAVKKVLIAMVAAFAVLLATAAIADARLNIFSIITSMNKDDSISRFEKYYKNVTKSDGYGETDTISELLNFFGKVVRPCDGVCRCILFIDPRLLLEVSPAAVTLLDMVIPAVLLHP
ncbi:hypothetical protein TIFTF001_035019 [Ficus carica]|uniref:Uncharacterized protein n=1 Tax=Ficus carica TaxID=3494 RepID=A0AA88E0X9_FICCA|nr:hypothetical protein TIFTF001_035019 [Ficus carica]